MHLRQSKIQDADSCSCSAIETGYDARLTWPLFFNCGDNLAISHRYLVLSLLLIGLSFVLTTLVINLHYRKPSSHTMPDWVRRVFIKTLPRVLLMKVPIQVIKDSMKSRRSKFLRQSDPALKSLQGECTSVCYRERHLLR